MCLRFTGHTLSQSFVALFLPLLLWWPHPEEPVKRLYWWLMVFLAIGLEIMLLAVALPQLPLNQNRSFLT